MQPEEYKELAAVPPNRPFVSHMQFTDDNGRDVTLFPAFRSLDDIADVSRLQSPVKASTVPMEGRRHNRWANDYHELVREFGPPRDDPESLFIFGRDEVYSSRARGNGSLKPQTVPAPTANGNANDSWGRLAPMNPRPPPPPPMADLELGASANGQLPPIKEVSVADASGPRHTIPKMRYIYAYPDEFRDWIGGRHALHPQGTARREHEEENYRPVPAPRRGISFESEKSDSEKARGSMLEELKSRINTFDRQGSLTEGSRKSLRVPGAHKSTITTGSLFRRTGSERRERVDPSPSLDLSPPQQQSSPGTFVSTTNASQFSYRPPPPPPTRRTAPSSSHAEIARLLKDTPDHLAPIIGRFLDTNFEHPQKTLDHSEFEQSEVPMKHYWQRVFKVKEGKKAATIKIENLLTIEPEIGPFHGFLTSEAGKRAKTAKTPAGTYRRVSVDSGDTLSGESGFSSDSAPQHSPGEPASPSSTSEMDLLTVVLRKVRQRKPLDWPELFLLKNDHCRFVVGREKDLKRMRRQQPVPAEATLLERDIVDNYRCYQRALEQVAVVDELYTRLAYLIMRAESYWYAAKITSDTTLRHHFYALARHNYADLLIAARQGLAPDNRSLLTILDKMTQILVEADARDPDVVLECQQAVFQAEKALEAKPDVKKERKVIQIKNKLLSLTTK